MTAGITRVHSWFAVFLTFFIISSSSLLGAPTTTQTSKPTTDSVSIEATVEAINAQIKRVEANSDISEEDKKTLLKTYNQALDQVKEAERWAARAKEYEKQGHVTPVLIKAIQEKLAEPVVKHVPNVPANMTLAKIEEKFKQAQADLNGTNKRKRDLELKDDTALNPNRLKELPKNISDLKQQIDEIKSKQRAPADPNEAIEFRIARRTLLRTQRRFMQNLLDALESDQSSLPDRMELFRLQLQLADREINQAKKEYDFWSDLLNVRRKEQAKRDAENARRQAANAIPEVRKLALENADLAEQRNNSNSPSVKKDAVTAAFRNVERISEELTGHFFGNDKIMGLKAKVDQSGVNKSISLLLRKERSRLPNIRDLNRQIAIRQSELEDVQNRIIQLQEEVDWYSDTDARLAEMMNNLDPKIHSDRRVEIEEAASEQLKLAYEYRKGLLDDYNSYFDQLFNLDNTERQLVKKAQIIADYIDEHIFWFPSTGSLFTSNLFSATWKACTWFADPDGFGEDGWRHFAGTVTGSMKANFLVWICAVAAFIIFLVYKYRIETFFTRHQNHDTFVNTLKMLIQTLLTTVPWPGLLFFFVWQITSWPHASNFTKAMAAGLYAVAVLFLTFDVLIALCLPSGIAERHFKWNPENTRIIRTNLYWFVSLCLPAVFVIATLNWQGTEDAKDSLGRLAFIILLLAFAIFMKRVLGPVRHTLQRTLARRWEGWGTWTHYVWYPLAIGVPVFLAILAAIGYYYTAAELAWRLLATLWILLGILITREVLLRWVFLTYRKIAQRQSNKKQERTTGKAVDPPAEEQQGLNLYTINDQTRKLLDSFVFFVMVVALWQIWDDVLPALAFFKQIHPWGFKLTDMFLAAIIAFMTYIAGKNIPGLLEITLLPRLPLDSGIRFAITKVTRYLIVILGTVIAFKTLGYGWSDIQWLVAAMTVGLSFGLQEIFANFISGLIILFERPMRVGDIVTVGSQSGTVTRIQIRATTITDGENKELIIPNKEFITGRVINWTLTDRILKLSLPVEIAYGSDTDLAQRLLLKIATSNPRVIQTYPPSAVFVGFGQNGIHFELSVHTSVENFGVLRHELNSAINRAFSEAGIQIPIPQQEIHVRAVRDLPYVDPKLDAAAWPEIPNKPKAP